MMKTIKEFYGDNFAELKLKDDETSTGGISHSEETLGEFMETCGLKPDDYINELGFAMKECGVEIKI